MKRFTASITSQKAILFLLVPLIFSCTPKVEVGVPDKPITINLNVKVEHEIRVAVDKELDTLFEEEDDIF